jgi:serine protease Do
MKSQLVSLLALSALLHLPSASARAEAVKDREGAVRGDRAKMENDARWIYNDVERGFTEAARTGKPLLVVLRCVPCLACMGMDAAVLQDESLAPLLDQFVCVRLINANTIDLSLFQFDYDLSFSTLIFNADRTLYGRYGSWRHQKDSQDTSLDTYHAALKRALDLHRSYPANKASLAGKQGGPAPFKTPVDIPKLAERYGRDLDWQGNVVKSCVHCHQIGDAFRAFHRDANRPVPLEFIYPMPAPETIGMALSAAATLRIDDVVPGSAAAKAGLHPGDIIDSFHAQPLISVADAAWVLHRAPDSGSIPLTVLRDGKPLALNLTLEPGWRFQTDISRRVGTWSLRGMTTGGLVLEDLDDTTRADLRLDTSTLALRVKGLGQYGPHGLAKRSGFQKDDILIEVEDLKQRLQESELLGRLLTDPRGKRPLPVTLLRNGKRLQLTLPAPADS